MNGKEQHLERFLFLSSGILNGETRMHPLISMATQAPTDIRRNHRAGSEGK